MGGVDVGGGLAVDLHFDGLQIADAAFGQKRLKGGVKARRSPDAAVDGKGELRRRQGKGQKHRQSLRPDSACGEGAGADQPGMAAGHGDGAGGLQWRDGTAIVGAMKTLLSLGHGYSAAALARRLLPQGWAVIGTTRSPEKAGALRAAGVEPLLWPGDLAPALARASHILTSAGPDAAGDPFLRAVPAIAAAGAQWVGYLSTTAVYGDHQGGWVDEDTALTPASERGRWRVLAEAQWQATGLPVEVFRLAGIYGPGRGPFEKVRNGSARRILKPGQVFSRIHVDDIAQVLEASIRHPHPGAVYNVCDDDPAPPEDVLSEAARLLGLPEPPAVDFDRADLTPMARSFYAESKRVRNDRIKRILGVTLLYPDFRRGLAALLEEE